MTKERIQNETQAATEAAKKMSLSELLSSVTAFDTYAAYHAANYTMTVRWEDKPRSLWAIREKAIKKEMANRLLAQGHVLYLNGKLTSL